MKRLLPLVAMTAAVIAAPAVAADCDAETRPQIEAALAKTPLEQGLSDAIKPLLAQPRYIDDAKQGATCSQPKLDHPLYPGIPVKECTYQRLGLTGWAMVANPSANVVAKWISNACAETAEAKTCAVRLTAHVWCASQFSFPVAANLIQPGAAPGIGVNTAFLHGVAIERPKWLPENTSVAADVQKQRLSALAASEKAFSGSAGRISWPSGVSPDVYAKYGPAPVKSAESGVGPSCPAQTRRRAWLGASRSSYTMAWRNGRNSMFDIAAKALMAGEPPGGAPCK